MINPIKKYKQLSVVAKAAMWFLISSLITKGISFLTTPIFARLMSKNDFGVFNVYNSWLQIFVIVSTFRLDYSIFNKGMSKYPENRNQYASAMLQLCTCINTVLLVTYLIFRKPINAFTELNTVATLCIFVELYFIPAVSFWSLKERYTFRYRNVVFVSILMAVLNSGLGIIAVMCNENKAMARIISCTLVEVIVGIVIYVSILLKGRGGNKREYIKFAVLFNIPLLPHYFSTYIVDQSDKIMIQKLVSFDATALYSIAYTVGGMIHIFTAALTNTLIPLQYHLMEEKKHQQINKNIVQIMFVVLGMLVLLSLVAPEIVLVLGGSKYMEAIYVMPPVIASVYFSFLYNLIANIEFFMGKNKFAMNISFVGAASNIILNFIFIPIYGYVVAAYTTLLSYIIYAVGHLIYANIITSKEFGKPILNAFQLSVFGAASVVICISTSLLYDYLYARIAGIVLILILSFVFRKQIKHIISKKRISNA